MTQCKIIVDRHLDVDARAHVTRNKNDENPLNNVTSHKKIEVIEMYQSSLAKEC